MKVRLPPAIFALSLFALACDKKKQEEPAIATSPSTPPAPFVSASTDTTPPKTGAIHGRVTFKGKTTPAKEVASPGDPFCEKTHPKDASITRTGKDDGLLDVVVRLAPGTAKGGFAHAPKATLMQDGCMYTPRVLGVLAGGELELVNKDRTMHNIHGFSGEQTAFNAGQPMGAPPVVKKAPSEPGLVRVKCDVHPWMLAWLVVTDHPYFTAVGDDGSFTLEAPVGTQTVEAVHPLRGKKTAKVEVAEGATVTVDFAFSEADRPEGT